MVGNGREGSHDRSFRVHDRTGRPAGAAVAADQTVLGNSFVAKNAGDAVKRKVIGKGKELASPNTLIGDPTLTGGFLRARTFAATGGTPSEQTLPLPQGTSGSTGKPFWSGDAAKGFKYKDPRGENGPVKLAQLTAAAESRQRRMLPRGHQRRGRLRRRLPAQPTDHERRRRAVQGDEAAPRGHVPGPDDHDHGDVHDLHDGHLPVVRHRRGLRR
jgi:hypothetical protein